MNKYRLFILHVVALFALLPVQPIWSLEREYVAPLNKAQWLSSGKKNYECVLTQTIPFYGEARFIHKSGYKVAFDLFSDKPIMDDAQVIVQSEPPPWRHDDKVFEIVKMDFERGHNPLKVNSPYASRMIQQVENGMSPVVIYRDLADGRDIIAVILSPVNFRKALAEYRECEKTLMDFDLEKIKNLNLYFATNKDILTERSKRDLRNVVRYLALDPSIQQIKVDAHADARGRRRYNDKLSEQRSEAVVKYLLSIGVKKEMIYSVSHGERKPTFNNKTAKGRAKNRRADVQLLPDPPPTPEEQEAMEAQRKAERRLRLTERSIFRDVPGKKAEAEAKAKAKAESGAKSDDSTVKQESSMAMEKQTPETALEDDEPPAPNFINFDHLVDKHNQKQPSK